MLHMKKALTAAAILTALCTSAFAADVQEQPQPSVRQRINCILNEDGRNAPGECRSPRTRLHHNPHKKFRHHRGDFSRRPAYCPELTEEQREAWEKRRDEWESMSPEERREAKKKWRQERRAARTEYARKAMASLTPEQQAEVKAFIREDMAQRLERRSRLQKMTPEQRRALRCNYHLLAKEAAAKAAK